MPIRPSSLSEAASTYDAIVVGSGYGGGVSASRLARMGLRVALFERGRLWRPGDFPITTRARRQAVRLTGRAPKFGDPLGLYSLSIGTGLSVLSATGLGGSSLINAGVTLRPDLTRLRRLGWPTAVTDDGLFVEGLARAEAMLGPASATDPERFAKFGGMRRLAEASTLPITAPPMTIANQPGTNAAGVQQPACRSCGDCWSGCNAGAKTTVANTYIVDAVDHGAHVFCESLVASIAKADSGWFIDVRDTADARARRRIAASILVLAAGTLGTNELLLRARRDGLPLSDRLGSNFSANGDDLVIASRFSTPVYAIATGFPPQAPRGAPVVGPHSVSLIDLGDADGPLWVHDGTMLAVMASLAPLEQVLKLNLIEAFRLWREGVWGDDLSRTQIMYVVGHDAAAGRLVLVKDHVAVEWPGYSMAPERVRAEAKVRALIERAGAEFGDNPFAIPAFGGNRIIAHPLGGCAMAETSAQGVIAHDGRVFDPSGGADAVHAGLYVCDGAALPSALGVSPLLSITALAERAMMLTARRLHRTLDVASRPVRPVRDALM
jgi:cholesterol oxidase